jgi:hypothetical protein
LVFLLESAIKSAVARTVSCQQNSNSHGDGRFDSLNQQAGVSTKDRSKTLFGRSISDIAGSSELPERLGFLLISEATIL